MYTPTTLTIIIEYCYILLVMYEPWNASGPVVKCRNNTVSSLSYLQGTYHPHYY